MASPEQVVTTTVSELETYNGSSTSQKATAGTAQLDPDPLFHFGFSQMPGVFQASTGEEADTSMTAANDSDEQFALNFSQLVDTQAMTQI